MVHREVDGLLRTVAPLRAELTDPGLHCLVHALSPRVCHAGHETSEDNVVVYREVDGLLRTVAPRGQSPGPQEAQPVGAPYPALEPLQQKRLAARQAPCTQFCLFLHCVWLSGAAWQLGVTLSAEALACQVSTCASVASGSHRSGGCPASGLPRLQYQVFARQAFLQPTSLLQVCSGLNSSALRLRKSQAVPACLPVQHSPHAGGG